MHSIALSLSQSLGQSVSEGRGVTPDGLILTMVGSEP